MSDNLSIQEIHNEELMMLDSIVAFCSSHNLKYWLVGGTLLGAVRHKGFIPWDDDVDIGMPRQDYEEFINSWTNSKYKVLSAANVDYHLPYAKIVDTKTKIVSKSRASKEIETGLFIDIFPYDGYGDKLSTAIRLQRGVGFTSRLVAHSFANLNEFSVLKKFIYLIVKAISTCIGKQRVLKACLFPLSKFSYDTSTYVGSTFGIHFGKEIVLKSGFDQTVLADFENRSYRIPVSYDSYLRQMYGEYMILPDENQRVAHSMHIVYK